MSLLEILVSFVATHHHMPRNGLPTTMIAAKTNQTSTNANRQLIESMHQPMGASPMPGIFETVLKRKGASHPVSAWNLRFLTRQLALFRLK